MRLINDVQLAGKPKPAGKTVFSIPRSGCWTQFLAQTERGRTQQKDYVRQLQAAMIIGDGRPFVYKTMTDRKFSVAGFAVLLAGVSSLALGQNATSLGAVRNVYVGSFGDQAGAQELRQALIDALKHSKLRVLTSVPADAVLEGIGEIWIRGHHSLSPRARTNDVYAEPIYGGYLSVRARGKNGEVLFCEPQTRRIRRRLEARPSGAACG